MKLYLHSPYIKNVHAKSAESLGASFAQQRNTKFTWTSVHKSFLSVYSRLHFSFVAWGVLINTHCNRQTGRRGPTAWTPSSPDLNPIHFYTKGLKSPCLFIPVNGVEILRFPLRHLPSPIPHWLAQVYLDRRLPYITGYPSARGLFTALMMEATHTSETSVDFNLTTRRYIPEGSKLHFGV
jgi:hypothetical protein